MFMWSCMLEHTALLMSQTEPAEKMNVCTIDDSCYSFQQCQIPQTIRFDMTLPLLSYTNKLNLESIFSLT